MQLLQLSILFCDIASAGGTMGLFLGFSGISFVELLYFLTLRAWWAYKQKQIKSKKNSTATKDSTANVSQTSGSETSAIDRDLKTADDESVVMELDARKPDLVVPSTENDCGSGLPRVLIEDECSAIVELE